MGDSHYFIGYTDYGTLYAVYGFLEKEFGYEYFAEDSYSLVNRNYFTYNDYDEVVVPDIEYVYANYGLIEYGSDTSVRERYMMPTRSDVILNVNGTPSSHNSLYLLPKTIYGENTIYYSNDGTDLCFTAHGNQTSFEAMTTDAANEIVQELKANTRAKFMILGQQDINKTCTCDGCMAIFNQYGTHSAKGIIFTNRVLEKVYAWFETGEGCQYARDFYILLLAYEKFVDAPVDEVNGDYVLKDGLTIHPKFGVYLAPINCDFTVPMEDDSELAIIIKQWSVCSNVMAFYNYDTNYHCYLTPFNSFASKQDVYIALEESGCLYIGEGGSNNDVSTPTGWTLLKIYLESQMRWDAELDTQAYIEKYFDGVYGDASTTMLGLYNSYQTYWATVQEKVEAGNLPSNVTNNHMLTNAKEGVWDKDVLLGWLNDYDTAFAEIEHLKITNPEEYERISRYIKAERISTLYLVLEIYRDDISTTDFNAYVEDFIADAELLCIDLEKEVNTYTIEALLTRWGVNA